MHGERRMRCFIVFVLPQFHYGCVFYQTMGAPRLRIKLRQAFGEALILSGWIFRSGGCNILTVGSGKM